MVAMHFIAENRYQSGKGLKYSVNKVVASTCAFSAIAQCEFAATLDSEQSLYALINAVLFATRAHTFDGVWP